MPSKAYQDLLQIFECYSERAATPAEKKLAEVGKDRAGRLEDRAQKAVRSAREANRMLRRQKRDSEKSYEDGYAQGLADGYGECSAILSKRVRRDG